MDAKLLLTIILPVFAYCQQLKAQQAKKLDDISVPLPATYQQVKDIPLPGGYHRIKGTDSLFADWLGELHLKKDRRVFLYNGALKGNQDAQFVVLDVSVGHKDLQQCADAIMRLRAEFLYSQKRYNEISFKDNNGKNYALHGFVDRKGFDNYLERVFTYCGTLSLEKQLHIVKGFKNLQPGDVLIKGGSPGHGVLVLAVGENKEGHKVYLVAQSYMPAQDIHILKNPNDADLSPWYKACEGNCMIYTPEWTFNSFMLRRW